MIHIPSGWHRVRGQFCYILRKLEVWQERLSDRLRVCGSEQRQMRHRDRILDRRLCGSASGICRRLA